eukprot:scaffold92143_cov69-Phaeocystis_antarctica.AAC.9
MNARAPLGLSRAVQHVEPAHLEVEGHLEVPRLDQIEDPLVRLLGRAAQRIARGGELRTLHEVQDGGRLAADDAPEEGAEVKHLLGAQRALLERQLLGELGQIVELPLEPAVAAALLGVAPLVPKDGVGAHGARHARARVKAVGERAAKGGQREVVVGAARERHEQVSLSLEVVEHRDVGEQVVAHQVGVGEEEPTRGHLAVQEDRPVGERVIIAHNVGQVRVLLLTHVREHHARRLGCGRPRTSGGARTRERRKHRSLFMVHRPHRGKGIGPADVLGVLHHHHLKVPPVHLSPLDRGQELGARTAAHVGPPLCPPGVLR